MIATETSAGGTPQDQALGFAPLHDAPIPYMVRTRTFYQAIGYPTPYRWAQFAEVKNPYSPDQAAFTVEASPSNASGFILTPNI